MVESERKYYALLSKLKALEFPILDRRIPTMKNYLLLSKSPFIIEGLISGLPFIIESFEGEAEMNVAASRSDWCSKPLYTSVIELPNHVKNLSLDNYEHFVPELVKTLEVSPFRWIFTRRKILVTNSMIEVLDEREKVIEWGKTSSEALEKLIKEFPRFCPDLMISDEMWNSLQVEREYVGPLNEDDRVFTDLDFSVYK